MEFIQSQVHGVVVVARNGDRLEYYQNPNSYAGAFTETTPLGEVRICSCPSLYGSHMLMPMLPLQVQSHQLGTFLRGQYFDPASPSVIHGMRTELVDTHQVHALVKAGGEGTVVFDSAIATLQGLFPPTPKNEMTLANGTTVMAPLGGYQYVPGQCPCSYQQFS